MTVIDRAPVQEATGRKKRTSFRPLLMRLHFYAGVFVAPFIAVAALTGLLYALTPQLDDLAYGDQLNVSDVGDERLPVSAQVEAAKAAVSDELTVSAVNLPDEADKTTQVVFSDSSLAEDFDRTVYVDPYTGEVQGNLVTSSDSTPLTTWLSELHATLHLGELGQHYSEIAASWLGVLAVSGLVLWLVQRRRKNRIRRTLLPEMTGPGRRRIMSWHGTVGVWALVGMLFLSATGLTWSRYAGANFTETLNQLNATAPTLDTSLPDPDDPRVDASEPTAESERPDAPSEGGAAATDRVIAAARTAGLDGPITVSIPSKPGKAWTVAQDDNVWPVHRDKVAVDPSSGEITARTDWDDRAVLSKLSSLGIQAHMGVLFGPANQIALIALALGLIAMIVWGYRMWWQRRPTRALDPPSASPPDRFALVVIGGSAVLLGAAVPLLGVSLLGFLLVDALIVGPLQARKAKQAVAAEPDAVPSPSIPHD